MSLILAVNAGSSSVKVSVFARRDLASSSSAPLAEAEVSGLTSPPTRLTYRRRPADGGAEVVVCRGREVTLDAPATQAAAFALVLHTLVDDAALPALASGRDVGVAAHRIVHGGAAQIAHEPIGHDTLRRLDDLAELAPLHNGPALAIVRACLGGEDGGGEEGEGGKGGGGKGGLLAGGHTRHVAVYDTAFHTTLSEAVRTYPIDQAVARRKMLRKYGFHGTSYAFITRAVGGFLGSPPDGGPNIIALHLGSGASACAIAAGRSVDTSMGLTPLAGLPGATRSGSVDPSLVFHYASDDVGQPSSASSSAHLHVSRAEEILNKESGWRALAGTADFAAVAAPGAGPACALAFDIFVDRVCGFVGAYFVALGGNVDALVFAGGIGERSARLRAAVVARCACLGFAIDPAANEGRPDARPDDVVVDITAAAAHPGPGTRGVVPKVLVCRTDEQLQMARGCAEDDALWDGGGDDKDREG